MGQIVMLTPFQDSSPLTKFAKDEYRDITDLTVIGTDTGLDMVTNYYQIEYHIGPIIDKAKAIEKRGGCDALIVGCFGDPGLMAVRQVTSMPVLGTAEASLCTAAMVGDKIGIIVPQEDVLSVTEKTIRAYNFSNHVVAIRSVGELWWEIVQGQSQESVAKMVDLCLQIIRGDGADVVIFGCIGFAWMVNQIREFIAKEGLKTPIIEPGLTVYNAAKMIVELGLNQDRRKLKINL